MAYSLVAPNVLLVFVTKFLSIVAPRRRHYFARTVYVGLSGVRSCLAVVLNLQEFAPRRIDVLMFGIRMPSRYASWVELALMQLLVPGSLLVHDLAGLLAGIAYVYVTRMLRRRKSMIGRVLSRGCFVGNQRCQFHGSSHALEETRDAANRLWQSAVRKLQGFFR